MKVCVGGVGGNHQYNGTFGTAGLILGWEAVVSSAGTEAIQTDSGDREIQGMLPSSCMKLGMLTVKTSTRLLAVGP